MAEKMQKVVFCQKKLFPLEIRDWPISAIPVECHKEETPFHNDFFLDKIYFKQCFLTCLAQRTDHNVVWYLRVPKISRFTACDPPSRLSDFVVYFCNLRWSSPLPLWFYLNQCFSTSGSYFWVAKTLFIVMRYVLKKWVTTFQMLRTTGLKGWPLVQTCLQANKTMTFCS